MINKLKKNILFSVYVIGFLMSLQLALSNYINSSFINQFIAEKYTGLVYIAEAVIAIIGFVFAARLLKLFGNFRKALVLIYLQVLSLFGLICFGNVYTLIFLMIGYLSTATFIVFCFDVFLENYSKDESTGHTRGLYLTSLNLAWMVAPALSGLILAKGEYWKIYLACLFLLLPIIIIYRGVLSDFKDPHYQQVPLRHAVRQIWKDRNIRNIFGASLLLHFFYSWMTIYMPIYLHSNLGFSWLEIGLIFSIMLVPFVLVQFPAGKLADQRLGEKEMLTFGFIIMACATGLIYFIHSDSIWVWALILFTTRIGAAIVEAMCDIYFFKKVNGQDVGMISFYRMSRPLAYVLGPAIGSALLYFGFGNVAALFIVLALITFVGLRFSLVIEDTN